MQHPLFYTTSIFDSQRVIMLNEENSKHAVQVLRMQEGEQLQLTDGKGNLYTAEITDAHKKKCSVKILSSEHRETSVKKVCIAVSPVKNNTRFEWFLEKATEIGVAEIIPLICTRTEKQHLRYERMQGILISAMLQSQQVRLPVLHEAVKFEKYMEYIKPVSGQKFIAHCLKENKNSLKDLVRQSTNQPINRSTILIGPEGDFTAQEIDVALKNNFIPVSLGDTRLRTETAALTAAILLCID